jgi:hypothetical protein
MNTTAFVNIWNQRVGAVAWDSSTRECAFEFDSEFLKSNLDLAPLQMPIHSANRRIFSMNGKRKDIEKEDLMKVAKAMNIKKADKIVSQISDVVSRWDEYANRVGVEKKTTNGNSKNTHSFIESAHLN